MPTNDEVYSTLQQVLQEQAKMGEQIKGALKRIDEQKQLTESVYKLASTVQILASSQESTKKKVDGLAKDIEAIKEKPAKRWDSIVGTVLSTIIGGVITYLLVVLGLKR